MNPSRELLDKISHLPDLPGCYLFRNRERHIIYIGKSKSLKKRVRQYFQKIEEKEGKYRKLPREVADVEIRTTPTERDALLLECRLIRQHKPRYNSQLVRDHVYLFLLIDMEQDYPTISIMDRYREEEACYGFFYNEDKAWEVIRLLNHIWQTPLCGRSVFTAHHRPCLNYHLKKCCAPCARQIGYDAYRQKIAEIRQCLAGKKMTFYQSLESHMMQAAEEMDYEKAAYFRDKIGSLDLLRQYAGRLNTFLENHRVLLFFRAFREEGFSVFYIEDGLTKARMDDWGGKTSVQRERTKQEMEVFTESICSGTWRKGMVEGEEQQIQEERFMTTCLMDIFADKYYITLPGSCGQSGILEKLYEGMENFR